MPKTRARIVALVAAVTLLGAAPSVVTFGVSFNTADVVLGAKPTLGDEFVVFCLTSGCELSALHGSWTAASCGSGGDIAYRPVASTDTSSATVQVFTSVGISGLYEISGWDGIDACGYDSETGNATAAPQATASGSDVGVLVGYDVASDPNTVNDISASYIGASSFSDDYDQSYYSCYDACDNTGWHGTNGPGNVDGTLTFRYNCQQPGCAGPTDTSYGYLLLLKSPTTSSAQPYFGIW